MKKQLTRIGHSLQQRWQLQSWMQVIAILTVFSLAGSTVVIIRPLLFQIIGFGSHTPWIWQVVVYLLFVIPAYQLLLLGFGWLFGQYDFFLGKVKRIASATIRKKRKQS